MLSLGIRDTDVYRLVLVIQDDTTNRDMSLGVEIVQIDIWRRVSQSFTLSQVYEFL